MAVPAAADLPGTILTPLDPASASLQRILRPFFRALGAAVTLGSGAPLGPEGPSVQIGARVPEPPTAREPGRPIPSRSHGQRGG